MSRRFLPCHAPGQAAMAPSRMLSEVSGSSDASLTVCAMPSPWHSGQAPAAVLGENASESKDAAPDGYVPAREYSMRSEFERVVTVPTVERELGATLLEGDGGWQPGDHFHLGVVALLDEPAGVGRHGLEVAALGFGVDGSERQGGLARA